LRVGLVSGVEFTESDRMPTHASAPEIDRIAIRQRPSGLPVMRQVWDKLLFLHWPVPAERLRPMIPLRLEIDTWEGAAWISVTPLVVRGLRPPFLPAIPWASRTLEVNLRTYVHLDGAPGVWFFSLDASNPLAVWGARIGYSLPYMHAKIQNREEEGRIEYQSQRTNKRGAPAALNLAWTRGAPLPELSPDTRDFFLVERYCLYSAKGDRIYRAMIHHRPWPLSAATLSHLQSTMVESLGLSTPAVSPLLHALREPLPVDVWRPVRV
jgi:uncharacterized protein YqjF (DUF2071 family)